MLPGTVRSKVPPQRDPPDPDRGPARAHWAAWFPAAAALAYPFLVYWVLGQPRQWPGLLLTMTALLGLCLCIPGTRVRIVVALVAFALAAAGVASANELTLLFLPPILVNLGLAGLFGHTLTNGGEALITRFARMEEPAPDSAVLIYTRRLTFVWTAFFLGMAGVSGCLAAFAPREAWVWFTAVGNYLCVAALFAIEYAYRQRRFPRKNHVSPRRQLALLRAALRARRPPT
jgi:uncharacterized membrane protein